MVKRSPYEQTCHDHSVEIRAKKLKSLGYTVKADLRDWTRPTKLCYKKKCAIPDIYAEKGKTILVIEVETPKSMKLDKKQHDILTAWKNSTKNTEVQITKCRVSKKQSS